MITYTSRKRSFAAFSSDDPPLQEPELPRQPTSSAKALQPTTSNISKLPTPPTSDPLSPVFKSSSTSITHNDNPPSSSSLNPQNTTLPSLFPAASTSTTFTPTFNHTIEQRQDGQPIKNQKLTQLTIDLGGPPNTRCKTCGMEYIPSSPEDRALHAKFHAESLGGVDVPASLAKALRQHKPVQQTAAQHESNIGLKGGAGGERAGREASAWRIIKRLMPREVLRRRVEGASTSERNQRRISSFHASGGICDAIVEVWHGDTRAVRGFAKRVLERVERELGAVETDERSLWDVFGLGTDYEGLDGGLYKVYLYVRGGKCVGCVLGQRIRRARRVRVEGGGGENRGEGRRQAEERGEALRLTDEYVHAELGISRIWVEKGYQRNGMASELLDAAAGNYFSRLGCLPGNVRQISRQAVAFSQPTEAGLKLIEGYVGGKGLKQEEGEKKLESKDEGTTWLLYAEWGAQDLRVPKEE